MPGSAIKSDTNSVTGECPTGQRAKPFKTASRAEPAPPEGWAWAKPIGLQGSSLAPRRAPCFDSVAVKTHKGLLLTKVTKPCYSPPIEIVFFSASFSAWWRFKRKGDFMGRISMPQGKGSQMHNRREYEKYGLRTPDNIDVSKSSENIILVDKDIKQAYQEIFGEALEKYNCKQKRADRRIVDYYDHIKKSKNGEKLFYEDVVQWGDKDDFQNPQTREKAKDALVKYVKDFEERNTNLKLIGAYIHMDEASPHLHLDYIPVAHGYSRGLETRNSLDKAMKQMGYQPEHESRKHNATKLWKDDERLFFGEICRNLGLEVEVERESTRKNLSVEEYKDARDKMIGGIEQERDAIVATVDRLQDLETYINDEIDKLDDQKNNLESVIDDYQEDLDQLKTKKGVLESQIDTVTAQKNKLRDQRDALAEEKGRLEAQTEPLKREYEAVLSEIKPLQELKTEIAELSDTGKVIFPGVVILKKKDFDQIQEQAKAYTANRDEIISLREREINISQKENKLDERENQLNNREDNLKTQEHHVAEMYNHQLNLNKLLEKAEKENKDKAKKIKTLEDKNYALFSENLDLKRQIGSLLTQISQIKSSFHKKLKEAYECLKKVVQATKAFKYDRTNDYKIKDLSKKQENLIDGVVRYSAKRAKEDDFPELAEQIENLHGIDQELEPFVEPPAKKRSRDYDHER